MKMNNMNDGVKNKLAKASGNAPKKYPQVAKGKDLNWKKPNTGKGSGKGAINKG